MLHRRSKASFEMLELYKSLRETDCRWVYTHSGRLAHVAFVVGAMGSHWLWLGA